MIDNLIFEMPLAELRTTQLRAEAMAPLMHPTEYVAKKDEFEVDIKRVEYFLELQAKLRKLREDYLAKHPPQDNVIITGDFGGKH